MIDEPGQRFLRACAARGVDFSRTVMLGRQQLVTGGYAERFFAHLGAKSVDSIDVSDFEGATILADLNRPLPGEVRRRFSAVYDGGTLEHVFDIATALRSSLDLVEMGGHYISSSPANNWPGHGFYQFSPELMFRVLSPQAGFEMRGAFVVELRRRQRWYRIPDPNSTSGRLYWRNSLRTLIVVVARRVEIVELSDFNPQQSDYAARWTRPASALGGEVESGPKGPVKSFIWKASPRPAKVAYESMKQWWMERFDPKHFRRVDLDDLSRHIR